MQWIGSEKSWDGLKNIVYQSLSCRTGHDLISIVPAGSDKKMVTAAAKTVSTNADRCRRRTVLFSKTSSILIISIITNKIKICQQICVSSRQIMIYWMFLFFLLIILTTSYGHNFHDIDILISLEMYGCDLVNFCFQANHGIWPIIIGVLETIHF